MLLKSPWFRISVSALYPLTILIEWFIMYRGALSGVNYTANTIPIVMIGDVTYIYLNVFVWTAYTLIGMAVRADKEEEPEMPNAVKFFFRTKDKMLINMFLSTACIIALGVYHHLAHNISMVTFIICEIVFAIILFGFLGFEGNNIIKREIAKRKEKANSNAVKETQVEDEKSNEGEAGGNTQ